MLYHIPRIIISALKGGSGKTVLSVGLTAAWLGEGRNVAPFKKGPDFIDASWLGCAAGRPCHNLDPFMMDETQIFQSFVDHSAGAELSLIEGSRGLFDGMDLEGCCSTAELGRWLSAPVVIIVDVTMKTRTTAALVMGCQAFDPGLKIVGIILNRVAGPRQESLVRNAIEEYCGIPVLGAVPKLKGNRFPERHMGLVPHQETNQSEKAIEWARKIVEAHLDMENLWELAHDAEPVKSMDHQTNGKSTGKTLVARPRIGYIMDKSFWFYYPENLEQLRSLGAELIEVNAISDNTLTDLDALYIGGGFPETQAMQLAENGRFRAVLKKEIGHGLPVYAECGGLMYLGEALVIDGKTYPMVGALPVKFLMDKRPQGHGYTLLKVTGKNPYFSQGDLLKGHE
ncbi:MAG: cobyrinate a,c-diamide synthase, partial [Deltaproteobacteria bacterium]|nr:cobyrinate a,c-diamide synthase [Deltaproteobacteria bacterium]